MVASVGIPPSISRAGAGACTTPSSHWRQAYFGPDRDQHPELRRHDIQPLALVFADPVQRAPAAAAGFVVDVDGGLNPRQMRRQRAAIGSPLRNSGLSRGRCRLLRARRITGRRLLDVFQPQQHLVLGQRLRPAAKLVALQVLDDLTQPFVLHPLGEQHRFQRLGIVGQSIARHDQIRSYFPAVCDDPNDG